MSSIYLDIYKIVQSIPKGRVLTYGLISHMIGKRMSAQGVGWALKALGSAKKGAAKSSATFDMHSVPWQRVVNAQGGTSTHKVAGVPPNLQRNILEKEGIKFDQEGKMDLDKYLWLEGIGAQVGLKPKKPTEVKAKAKANATVKQAKPKAKAKLDTRSKKRPKARP